MARDEIPEFPQEVWSERDQGPIWRAPVTVAYNDLEWLIRTIHPWDAKESKIVERVERALRSVWGVTDGNEGS